MNAFRLSAAGGALALHGLVLTGVLWLSVAPPAKREITPLQVRLITPPQPLPVAPTPRAEAPVARAEPAPPRRPPRALPAPTRPAPPQPPQPATPAPPPPAAPPAPTAAANPITLPPVLAPGEPVRGPARPALDPTPATAAAPTRSAPRVDANWSGNTPPPYPAMARRMGDQGEVRLDVRVGADGTVAEIRLRKSSGSPLLDRTAIDTVRKWRFKPATVDGQPVAEWYHDWRWVFRLEG